MSPEPSNTTCRIIMAGGEEADNRLKPTNRNTSVRKMAYSSSLLDASFGTLVDDTDSEFEMDDHSYLLTLATTTEADSQAEAERRLSVESSSGSAAAEDAAAAAAAEPSRAAPLEVDSTATTGNLHRVIAAPPEKSCSYHNSQAEDTTTAETEDETQQDDDEDEDEEEEGDDDDDDDEIGSEVDDFSLTSDLGFSQEDDLCHDYHQESQGGGGAGGGGRGGGGGGGGRLALIFDMLPTGGGGRRGCQQRSSSMGFGSGNSDNDRLNQSMHGGVPAPGDALSKTIHGGACTSHGHNQHHMSPIQEKRTSLGEGGGGGSGGTTTRGRRSSRPSIGTVKQRVSDYEMKRPSCGSIATNASSSSDCARGRESYPPPTTTRGRPTLLSPTSWGSNRLGSSLSPVPRGSTSSWGSSGAALSPIRRGISPLRIPGGSPWSASTKSTNRSRNTCCPRNSLGEFLHSNNNNHRGSNTTVPLDLVDLDEHSVGGASFKTFNTMNMDHSATELQRNISGSAFAMRSRFASAEDGFPTIRERRSASNRDKRASTTTGQKINSFVESQFTTFAKNVDGIQDKFEKMTTNMGETAQVIQEEPNSRVLGAVVQARFSCFAGNLQHIRKSTCFVRNLRTICGLPNNNNHKDNSNRHHRYDDSFDPFGDFDTTDHHRLYSHQDKMY